MDDLISRQATIEALRGNEPAYEDGEAYIQWEKDFYSIYSINGLQSDRKVGKWIEDEFIDSIRCSHCGAKWNWFDNDTESFKFCPNCGAEMMKGESNEKNEMGDQKAGP